MKALRITLPGLFLMAVVLAAPGPVTAQQYKEDFNAGSRGSIGPSYLSGCTFLIRECSYWS